MNTNISTKKRGLYDILACPVCKKSVTRQANILVCPQCQVHYPIVDGIPVLLPGGVIPDFVHESELLMRDMYVPWIDRLMLQSLWPHHLSLNLGSGNMRLDLPNVIRMDIVRTPYVDVVGDAHALPFLPESFDFVFSLAVIEHLCQPFMAAHEMYNVLREGGYVFGECNFVFPYHGYPHHYFNASMQGMSQWFKAFRSLRVGVSPHQMPSFAIRSILEGYLQGIATVESLGINALRTCIQQVIQSPLRNYDAYFTEEAAHRVAAGVYFFGVKSTGGVSQVLSEVFHDLWERTPTLQTQFPDPLDLGHINNVLLWAKGEGQQQIPELVNYFESLCPFQKNETVNQAGLCALAAEPIVEPLFSNIPEPLPEEPVLIQANKNTNAAIFWSQTLGYLLKRTGEVIERQGAKGFLTALWSYIRWRFSRENEQIQT